MPDLGSFVWIIGAVLVILVVIPLIVTSFLRNVDAGSIRMVSWVNGGTNIYRGPGKSLEVPLLTQGTTLSSKAINDSGQRLREAGYEPQLGRAEGATNLFLEENGLRQLLRTI